MLGGGGSKVRVVGPAAHGRTGPISSGMVTRPASGNLDITADLWVDESGSYNTSYVAATADTHVFANRGWIGKGTNNWLRNVGWHVTLHGAAPGANLGLAGVTFVDDGTAGDATAADGQVAIRIAPSASYCPTRAGSTQTTAVINILAFPSAADLDGAGPGTDTATAGDTTADGLFPALAAQRSLGGAYAASQLRIACPPPASSANMGEELVPENPFPTDR